MNNPTESPAGPSALPNPQPHRRGKWFRRLGWTMIWLITLLALLYAFEDWRGRRVWKNYVAEAKAAGEHLDPGSLTLPEVPDEQNFAAAPLFAPLFDYEMKREGLTSVPVWKDAEKKEYLDSLSFSPPVHAGNWRRGQRTNLPEWHSKIARSSPEKEVAIFDRTEKDWKASAARSALDPTPASVDESIAEILQKLEPVATVMEEVSEAAARPFSRFPIRDEGLMAVRPHLKPMINFSQIARLRASARLAAGDKEGAFEDTLLGFRLAEKMAGDPVLLGYLVRLSMEEAAMVPLWEGLVGQHWNDQQLQALQEQLLRINHASELRKTMRAERQFAFSMFDSFRAGPRHFGTRMSGIKEAGIEPPLGLIATISSLIPKGWFDLNKAETGRLYQRILDIAEVSPPRFHPDRKESIEEELRAPHGVFQDYGKPMARLAASAAIGVVDRSAAAQSTVDLALIAVALERHRLRHGSYPAELAELDPEVIDKTRGIPADPLSGHPPRYRATEDGRFVLYFDSWNQKDDGGVTEYNYPKGPKPKIEMGDWVWPQPTE